MFLRFYNRTNLNFGQSVSEVDQGEGKEVKSQPIGRFAFKPNEQRPKFVNPGKGAFDRKAILIDRLIKEALSATLFRLATARIFRNVRLDAIIPEHLARRTRIEATITIEDRSPVVERAPFQIGKQRFDGIFNAKDIVMIASNNFCGRKNIPISVR